MGEKISTASLTASSNVEGSEGKPASWQIDECQEKLIEQYSVSNAIFLPLEFFD